jgi:hypothetical protein
MHHVLAPVILIALIAFAFGERTARLCVQIGLLAPVALVLYVLFRALTDAPDVPLFAR